MYPGAEIPTGIWNSGRSNATWRIIPKTVPTTCRMKLRQLTLNTHLGSGNICAITFLFVDQSTPTFFRPTWEPGMVACRWSRTFPIFDMLTRSRDICDQIQQLSEIAQNFGRFFALPYFFGRALQKCTDVITPAACLRLAVNRKSFVRILLLARKLFNQSISH